MTNDKLNEILESRNGKRAIRERILDVFQAMGLQTDVVDMESVADAMEKMLALIDMQNDLLDAATESFEVITQSHETFALQINDYCLELETHLNQAEQDIKQLQSRKPCSCDIVS